MKKFFNFRPAMFFTLFFAAGIYFGLNYIKYGFSYIIVFSAVLLLMVLSGFLMHKFPLKNMHLKGFFSFLNSKKYHLLSFAAASAAGFVMFLIVFNNFSTNQVYNGKFADVQGNVIETYETKNGNYYFLLEKVIFTIDENSQQIGCKVFVYINGQYSENLPQTGDMLFFSSEISASNIFEEGKINTYAYRNDIEYNFFLNEGEYISAEDKPSLFITVKNYIKQVFRSNMREDNSEICYALITGDSLLMDNDLKQEFFSSGIAHVFSVSGLNIGVLSFSLIYLLNKIKIKNIYQIIIITAILLFYSGICSFSPSVLRAFLMTEIFLVSKAFGKKYDALTSISFAILLILIISPLMLFDVGFLLSISSVFGIILLNKKLNIWLKFIPKIIRLPLTVSIAAQIGLLPILADSFKTLPLFSLLLNLAVIPLINISYIMLLALIILTAIFPFLSFLFFVPQGLMEAVKIAVKIVTSTGLSTININPFYLTAIIYYVIFIYLSGFVFVKIKTKTLITVFCSAVFLISSIFTYMPFNYKGASVSFLKIDNADASLITSGGKIYYVYYGSGIFDYSLLENYLDLKKINSIEAAIFMTADLYLTEQIGILKRYGIKKIIMPYSANAVFTDIEPEINFKYLLSREVYIYENLNISSYYYNADNNYTFYAQSISIDGFNTLYINDSSQQSLDYLLEYLNLNINVIYSDNKYDYLEGLYKPDILVTQNYYLNGLYDNIYSTRTYGHLIFDIKNDKIIRKYDY